MNSTIPSDLLELKARFETWRTNRKFVREPIPDELRQATAEMTRRYPPSLVGRILKIDPSRLKRPVTKKSARPRKQPAVAFFKLPTARGKRFDADIYADIAGRMRQRLNVGFHQNADEIPFGFVFADRCANQLGITRQRTRPTDLKRFILLGKRDPSVSVCESVSLEANRLFVLAAFEARLHPAWRMYVRHWASWLQAGLQGKPS